MANSPREMINNFLKRDEKPNVLNAIKNSNYNNIESVFNDIPDYLKNDEDVVLATISIRPQLASNLSINTDTKTPVIIAAKQALRGLASNEYGENASDIKEFLDKVLNQYSDSFSNQVIDDLIHEENMPNIIYKNLKHTRYIHDSVRDNKDIMISIIKNSGEYSADGYTYFHDTRGLKLASNRLKDDKDVVIAAVSVSYEFFRYVSDRLKNDKDVIMAAIKNSEKSKFTLSYMFDNMPEAFKKDKDIMMEFVLKDYRFLKDSPDEIKDNKDFVMSIISKSGGILKYVSDNLKNDKDVVKAAVDEYWENFQYASDDIRKNKEMIDFALSKDKRAFKYVDLEMQKKMIKEDINLFNYANKKVQEEIIAKNPDLMKKGIRSTKAGAFVAKYKEEEETSKFGGEALKGIDNRNINLTSDFEEDINKDTNESR